MARGFDGNARAIRLARRLRDEMATQGWENVERPRDPLLVVRQRILVAARELSRGYNRKYGANAVRS